MKIPRKFIIIYIEFSIGEARKSSSIVLGIALTKLSNRNFYLLRKYQNNYKFLRFF